MPKARLRAILTVKKLGPRKIDFLIPPNLKQCMDILIQMEGFRLNTKITDRGGQMSRV